MNRLLRVEEVAAALGVGRTTVYQLIRAGRLRVAVVPGVRGVRVSSAEVERFISFCEARS